MHSWEKAIRTAFKVGPIIVIVVGLLFIDPVGVILTVGIFLGIIFFIIVIAMLIKLYWYILDKWSD